MKNRLFFILSILASVTFAKAQEIAVITVEAGASDRYETPVSLLLDPVTFEPDSGLVLYEWVKKTKIPVLSQIEQLPEGRVLSWILTAKTVSGGTREYTLEKGAAKREKVIKVTDRGDAILLSSGDDKIMEYHYGVMMPPEGVAYEYRRSGFIHPLWSPAGEVLTNIQPADHYHHYGIWNPLTGTTFEGEYVNFQDLQKGLGTVRFKAFNSFVEGNILGGFKAVQEYVVFKPGYEKTALNESVGVKVWNVRDEEEKKVWLWDFASTLNCASESPLDVNEYRYGGLGLRATAEWNTRTSSILTSEGKTRKDADDTNCRWMFCNGAAGGNKSGILFLSYPSNYNYPEPIRVWPETMNDVYMNFCPFKNKNWYLEEGKDYTLRYRIVVYSGEMTQERAEQYWQDFANPPAILVKKGK
ncbi:MAG: PmoA family protein [Candidatus Symbiothrix sp.]|jgi:hypothetical protein|nr:PmoA family protein [Candidatus Symbiothrix sp.]